MASGIYRIVNKQNGHQYIGRSSDIEFRWRNHVSDLRGNKHVNEHLQYAWNKYGNNVWEFEILEEGIPDYALASKEHEYFEKLEPEYNVRNNKYHHICSVFISREDIDDHPIYKFDDHNKLRPKWHAWVYGGGENPLKNVSRRRKFRGQK